MSAIEDSQTKFDSSYQQEDAHVDSIISPYRVRLDSSMNEVLVYAAKDMLKAKPESSLGNLLADACKLMAEEYSAEKVDFAILNYGGIRVPSINQGPVSLGNVYELMPFDNYLVLLRLNGAKVEELMHLIAKAGGWPISGLSFEMDGDKASHIQVAGMPLDYEKQYTLAISDYLANGGDNLELLVAFEQENTNVLLREAFIAYFKKIAAEGKMLDANLENRITKHE
ncbi:MAG: 5'-nucleotidase [Chitinophagales bacterium]